MLKSKFYESREWRDLRYKVLVKHKRRCMCCFVTNSQLHIDHIKPISKFPQLALDMNNLQILCKDCNKGKSNKDDTDFRYSLAEMNSCQFCDKDTFTYEYLSHVLMDHSDELRKIFRKMDIMEG